MKTTTKKAALINAIRIAIRASESYILRTPVEHRAHEQARCDALCKRLGALVDDA